MNINELTVGQVKEISSLLGGGQDKKHAFTIGANYYIRTVTHHHTGRLVMVTEHELVLEDAAWIADSGRWQQALETCAFNEVEMFPKGYHVIVGRGSLIDAVQISKLPTEQK